MLEFLRTVLASGPAHAVISLTTGNNADWETKTRKIVGADAIGVVIEAADGRCAMIPWNSIEVLGLR